MSEPYSLGAAHARPLHPGTIFFLCSDDAAHVTGTETSVDGGQHID